MDIGIVGAGTMGSAHFRAVREAGSRVVAVHDVRLDAAKALAAEAEDALATDDLHAFFRRRLDGVVIATPPPVRLDPIREACRRGVHLLVEKPPALSLHEAHACLREIERAGVTAAVGLQLRYTPLYERLRELLAEETVHLVRTACTVDYYLTFRMAPWFLQNDVSGGPLAEQAVHLLDCVRFVLGDPKPMCAHALAERNMALDRTDLDAANAIQMTYELDNGVLATHMNHCGTERFAFDLEVVGPHLRLHANITTNRITGYRHAQDLDEPAPAQNRLGLNKTTAWLRAIATGDRSLVRAPYADAVHTQALIEAAVRSQNTGRFVRIEELTA
jgi:predicted dehydrogenase